MTPSRNYSALCGQSIQRILVTRPQPNAARTAKVLNREGYEMLVEPLVEVRPAQATYYDILNQHLQHAAVVIVMSPNVVRYAAPHWHLPRAHYLAVGPGSATALNEVGVKAAYPAHEHNHQGLLNMPMLQRVQGQNIVICSGGPANLLFYQHQAIPDYVSQALINTPLVTGGDELQHALQQRGAHATVAHCYERAIPTQAVTPIIQHPEQHCDAIFVSSGEALRHMIYLLKNFERSCTVPILAISERIAYYAREWGFKKVVVTGDCIL